MAYKGNTPAQRITHVETMRRAEDLLGTERFLQGKHLVYAGPTGGDISTLLALGVPAERIIAVDHDPNACAQVRCKFPKVHTIGADVVDVIGDRSFDFVFADATSQLSAMSLNTVVQIANVGVSTGGVLAVTFLSGREQDTFGGVRQRVLEAQQKMRILLVESDSKMSSESVLPMSRIGVLQEEFTLRMVDRYLYPVCVLTYVSKGDHELKGMPMCIYLGQVLEGPSPWEASNILARLVSAPPEFVSITASERELGPYAMDYDKAGYDAALLMNVTPFTVRAWRAHAARGTASYKRRARKIT